MIVSTRLREEGACTPVPASDAQVWTLLHSTTGVQWDLSLIPVYRTANISHSCSRPFVTEIAAAGSPGYWIDRRKYAELVTGQGLSHGSGRVSVDRPAP